MKLVLLLALVEIIIARPQSSKPVITNYDFDLKDSGGYTFTSDTNSGFYHRIRRSSSPPAVTISSSPPSPPLTSIPPERASPPLPPTGPLSLVPTARPLSSVPPTPSTYKLPPPVKVTTEPPTIYYLSAECTASLCGTGTGGG